MTVPAPTTATPSPNLHMTPQWWAYLWGNESTYRDEVERLTAWCTDNNLLLNTTKIKDIVMDIKKKENWNETISHQRGPCRESVTEFTSQRTCPGVWTHQSWQRRLSREGSSGKIASLKTFITSILCCCLCVWLSSCTTAQRKSLQRIVKTAQEIICCLLPSQGELHSSCCLRKAENISKGSTHPTYSNCCHQAKDTGA